MWKPGLLNFFINFFVTENLGKKIPLKLEKKKLKIYLKKEKRKSKISQFLVEKLIKIVPKKLHLFKHDKKIIWMQQLATPSRAF